MTAIKTPRLLALICASALAFFGAPAPAAATQVWSGARQTFTKVNYADWTLAANQDRITTNVWLTRKSNASLYNCQSETGYISSAVSPAGTEWAFGTTADLPLTFKPFVGWNGNNPAGVIGSNAVLHLTADDIYIDIKITAWTGANGGGGFAYERAGAVFLTLNGASTVYVQQSGVFDDLGASAADSSGNSLTVNVTGTVDTGTLGEYFLDYTATDSRGYTASARRTVIVMTLVPIIWNGPRVTFAKADYADYTSVSNQDRITSTVWLTRQNSSGLFNINTEESYVEASSPYATSWAFGSTSNLFGLSYQCWGDLTASVGGPENMVGRDAVLYLPNENTYVDIRFTAWTPDATGGGGFSYERAVVPATISLAGSTTLRVQLDGTFDDPGATALDAYGNPLTVTVSGTVDTASVGAYELTYSATVGGYTARVTRLVRVLTTIPKIWNGPRTTFTKVNFADWTQAANQDRITPDVWLTRQDATGLFNIKSESSYNSSTPSNTEWAYGTIDNLETLSFGSWSNWARLMGNTDSIVGREAILHLISEDIYIEIKFTSWQDGRTDGGGGGFSYERAKAPASIALNGKALTRILLNSTFDDPGVTALDASGNPLMVTTNGTVDTATLGTYDLTYSATSDGYTASVTRQVRVMTSVPIVWDGPRVTFTKNDNADWNVAANQDRITPAVWLTRQNDRGLYNRVQETYYDNNADTAPADTEWAYGTTDDLETLTFQTWYNWAQSDGGPPSTVDRDAVLHLISEDIYIDIKITSWTENSNGGGFSYERAKAPSSIVLVGASLMFVQQGGAFVDTSASATDVAGNPLEVTISGTIDFATPGTYVLTYSATAGGYTSTVTRKVRVVATLPEIWNGSRITFTRPDNVDCTLPANQDQITPAVWLTRADTKGLFNIVLESYYDSDTDIAPTDTEWAFGTTANLDLTFQNWHDWVQSDDGPPSTVGRDAVLHLISEDIYIDIKFTSWTEEGGGGFSYERAAAVSVSLNGDRKMNILLHGTFVDPGATAVDLAGTPLAVVTNGTVNVDEVGTYQLIYSATDAKGRPGAAIRTVRVVASLPVIWDGPRMTFTKDNYSDWTESANQDRITPNTWLTRQNNQGLFNIAQEASYDRNGEGVAPKNTEWAYGTTANYLNLTFQSWHEWSRDDGSTDSTVGKDAVLHLIAEDIYIDIKFTSWTRSNNGGGFSYERSKAFVTVTLNGLAEQYLMLGNAFTDPGATAEASDGTALDVTTSGTVDTGTVGNYQLTYSATDTLGHAESAIRMVHVMTSDMYLPVCSMMPSFSQNPTYANALLNDPITVWGRVTGIMPPFTYTLDFGDGSDVVTGTVDTPSFIGQPHAYTSGGSKTATLSVTDDLGRTVTRQSVIKVFLTATHELRINMAVEKGLLYLYRNQLVMSAEKSNWPSTGGENSIGASGFALLALQENGHLAGNSYAEDIYAETVQKGLNWLVDNGECAYYTLTPHSDGLEVHDSDSNGNGKGAYLTRGTYASGVAAAALIMAVPNAQSATNTFVTSGPFTGVSYYELMQDIFDQYSYSQGDGDSYRGGWRYSVNTAQSPESGGLDGSAQQWPNMNFIMATERWNLAPAAWVITNSVHAFQRLQNENGACGYSSNDSWLNSAKSGGMLVSYKVGGKTVGDSDVNRGALFIAAHWYDLASSSDSEPGWAGDFYAMYGVKKGLHLQGIETLPTPEGDRNWYDDMSAWLLGNAAGATPEGMPFVPATLAASRQNASYAFGQNIDGSWRSGAGFIPNDAAFNTAGAILILTKTVTVLMPVAVIAPVSSQPAPISEGQLFPFAMTGSSSYHQDAAKSIVEYLWDWDVTDGVNWSSPDASGSRPINPGYAGVGTYTVTLRVKDNSEPALYATKAIVITVTAEALPPVAVAIPPGHPAYTGRIGEDIMLDGSASYDPSGYPITLYSWDLNGNGIYGEESDTSSSSPTTLVHFVSEYVGAIGLQVTANGRDGSSLSQISIYATETDLALESFGFVGWEAPAVANVHAVLLNSADSSRDFDTVLVRFYSGNPLTSGAQISSNCYVTLPKGVPVSFDTRLDLAGVQADTVYMYVDAGDAIPESDELNNVRALSSVPRYALTVTVNAPERGEVEVTPDADGEALYAWGTEVHLTARAAEGSRFFNWSGDASGTSNDVALFVDATKSVTANFGNDTPPGVTLEIQSTYGIGTPLAGLYTNAFGTVLSNIMVNPEPVGGTQYVCTGWSMAGGEPASGLGGMCVMTATNNAVLTWLWATQYQLTTAAGPDGTVTVNSGWQPMGVTTQITAVAAPYYHFASWSGDASGASNPLELLMDAPKSVTANFAANWTTTHPTPEGWLAKYGIMPDFDQNSLDDADHDGFSNWQEFVAGTDPTNTASRLVCTAIDSALGTNYTETVVFYPAAIVVVHGVTNSWDDHWETQRVHEVVGYSVTWPSVTGRLYSVEYSTNLLNWLDLEGAKDLQGISPVNTFTDLLPSKVKFYRVKVRLPSDS